MAGKGVSYMKWRKLSGRCFMTALSSALLEWLLILMLLINGIFAYLITWFARYCDLPIPCLLCSRLDHVFGSKKPGSHWDLMCKSHKTEISSLVSCGLHDKLVDVHGMCENCLFSFATKDKSNSETYRLLVGKLGLHVDDNGVEEKPLLGDQKPLSRSTKICCCCNEPWSSRTHAQALVQTKSVELEKGDVDAPLTREFRLNLNSLKKETKRPNFLATMSAVHESFEDCSPHFGYSELKLNSDTESEDHICNAEEPEVIVSETYHSQRHLVVESLQSEVEDSKRVEATAEEKPMSSDVSSQPPNLIDREQSQSDLINDHDTLIREESRIPDVSLLEPLNLIDDYIKSEDTLPEKPIIVQEASASESPNLIDHGLSHSDLNDSSEAPSALPATVGHGLEELNWQDIDLKTESSSASDPISTDNVPESPNAADIQADPSEEDDAGSYQKDTEGPLEVAETPVMKDVESIHEAEKEHATTAVLDSKINDDVGVQPANSLDLGDAYKLALSSRGRQLSSKTLEQLAGNVSPRFSEDLKLLLAQLSVAKGLEIPLTGRMSPRVSASLEDSRTSDTLASLGMHILQRRISLERNDSRNSLERYGSGFESLDLSTVSEVDGESTLERLKRQVEHDKKLMSALCKELEEERSASAIATNQTLAMITRLQEEKAALQMEALHDIRLMEEQAEYDVEALDRANDLLAEREKEIQDLEAELDYYRNKYPDDELTSEDGEELSVLYQSHAAEPTSNPDNVKERLHSSENIDASSLGRKSSSPKCLWLGFEDDRLYISQRLSNLEKKLHLFSNSGIYQELQNGDCLNIEEEKQVSSLEKDECDVLQQTENAASLGSRRPPVRRAHSLTTPRSNKQDSLVHTEVDMVTLVDEVSTLNERLHTLEADRNFLEHAINSLRNGEEGVRFLLEIASHLRDLRRAGIKRNQSLA